MASVTGAGAKAGWRPSFHLVLVLAMAAYVFIGFGITYIVPEIVGTRPPDSPIVHLHGAAFFSWILLLVTQASLINAKNVKLHRSLGMLGVAVATFAVTMGVFIMLAAASITKLQGVGPSVFWLNVTAPPSFGIVFAMAIRAVKRPEMHRNLMVIATTGILMPGINRVYMQGLGIQHFTFIETYLTMDAFIAACLWHERRTLGRISRATWTGAGIIVGLELLNFPISTTAWWSDFVFWLGSFVHYE
ncbi:hypothetical protein GRI89_07875 [Altererythrobacter salegens]|uniref:Uncharacterized protein n=1 Tax=Croceibacterium salegens TaxID=1737568 RepID=A0A6I4SVB5_9SPHN|nr:hypothetical protein [Croceibacterium salegens]MXO59458.1 hypothetical protein [Croceibacterium salegens]